MNKRSGDINRILDPFSFIQINSILNEFEFDPDLELYDELYQGNKFLFFEVNLAIDKLNIGGRNAVYYFKNKIADSLEDFFQRFIDNPNLVV